MIRVGGQEKSVQPREVHFEEIQPRRKEHSSVREIKAVTKMHQGNRESTGESYHHSKFAKWCAIFSNPRL